MVKPLLELCRVDPGDAFTYLSWSHIMSRSNFRIREKKFSNFIFYAYFYKGNFKAPVEKLFSAHLTKFFHRILKIFLISKTISTWVLEVFLDDAEQVFILNYDVWMRFRQNRSDFGSRADPHYRLCVALHCTLDENILRKINLLKKPAAGAARIRTLYRSPPLKMSKIFGRGGGSVRIPTDRA